MIVIVAPQFPPYRLQTDNHRNVVVTLYVHTYVLHSDIFSSHLISSAWFDSISHHHRTGHKQATTLAYLPLPPDFWIWSTTTDFQFQVPMHKKFTQENNSLATPFIPMSEL